MSETWSKPSGLSVGDPAEILSPRRHDDIWRLQEPLDFPNYVFGRDRPGPGDTIMPEVMPRYCKVLGRHTKDRRIGGTD